MKLHHVRLLSSFAININLRPLNSVVIFARMSPDDKERVLKRLKQQGRHTFMCGDGANDVGALKQAHVGVALLSGFGSANTKMPTAPGETPPPTKAVAKVETFAEKMTRVKVRPARYCPLRHVIDTRFEPSFPEFTGIL